MPPRSAKRGAAKKSSPSSRSKKLKPSASDPSSPSLLSEEETTPEPEVLPFTGDEEAPEVEAVDASAEVYTPPPDTVEEEKGLTKITPTEEITENKGLETGKDPDDPFGVEQSGNEKISQALSSVKECFAAEGEGAPPLVEEEKTVDMEVTLEKKDVENVSEDQDVKKFEEVATAEEQVGLLGEELHTQKISRESEIIVLSESKKAESLEDADPCDAGDKMKIDEDGGNNVSHGVEGVDVDEGHISDANEENMDNEENDQAFSMQSALREVTEKESDIFVGGLDKGAVEDDLVKVFSVFGDILSVRIAKHPTTKKSKGFAFISFASSEYAKKALAELKDGIEVKGKVVRIEACHENSTLYLGNICKTWNRNQVMEKLKSFGVEQIESMILPEDAKIEGKIRGFAFLEFSSHSDAMAAFQCLRKPDVDFGRDRTAKVAFAHSPLHTSREVMSQTKTVYVEGFPLSWNEEKVQEICKKYGQVEEVRLPRNFGSRKRKSFGFVEFSSQESALAFVEGINGAQLGDGDAKVKANLAKSSSKGQSAHQGARGGFVAKKDEGATQEVGNSKKKKNAKSKHIRRKEEAQLKLKNVIESKPSTSQIKGAKDNIGLKTAKTFKRKKQGGKTMDNSSHGLPSKRAKIHHNRNYASEPQLRHSDLEPHAGYLPAAKQVSAPYEYDLRRSGAYDSELRSNSGYARGLQGVQTSYPAGYANYQQYGYRYPSRGAYAPRRPNY